MIDLVGAMPIYQDMNGVAQTPGRCVDVAIMGIKHLNIIDLTSYVFVSLCNIVYQATNDVTLTFRQCR